MVTDLIAATPEDDVLRRDIYDRPPIFRWTAGRVALLGDSAHAMQPNLGQGGCMAIEDAYEFAKIMSTELQQRRDKAEAFSALELPYPKLLQRYQREVRCTALGARTHCCLWRIDPRASVYNASRYQRRDGRVC